MGIGPGPGDRRIIRHREVKDGLGEVRLVREAVRQQGGRRPDASARGDDELGLDALGLHGGDALGKPIEIVLDLHPALATLEIRNVAVAVIEIAAGPQLSYALLKSLGSPPSAW